MGGNDGRTAIVVGGGIGGLATAIALHRRGWSVEVLERAPEFGEVGAGLSLWANGVRALEALGLGQAVRDHSMPEREAGLRTPSGRWLSCTDTGELERRHGAVVMMYRPRLLEILCEALPPGALRPGTEVRAVHDRGDLVEVEHDGGVSRADLLVGADGIHSSVRRAVWPGAPEPRYAGYTAWRTVIDPGRPLQAGGETWGRGERVGLATVPDGRVYMFGVADAPAGQSSPGGELGEVRRRFSGWHAPIPDLLAAADEDAFFRSDVFELPPLETFVSGRIALLGDAAHAMTPNMGQGGNQALEDAVTLAAMLDRHAGVPAALTAYDRDRRPRTQMIAKRSRRIGVVAQWSWGPAATLRNAVVRATPASALLRALEPVLGWRPPA